MMGHVVNTEMTRAALDGRLRAGDIVLDLKKHMLIGSCRERRITGKKRDLLKLFIENKGSVVTKPMMFAALYPGEEMPPELKIFPVFVCQLNKLLEDINSYVKIANIYGVGYELAAGEI